MSYNKLLFALCLSTLATPTFAQEANFDIQDEKLLCIGTQAKTGYKQYCVEQCVVNGPSIAFMGEFTRPNNPQVVHLYTMDAQFDCPRGQASSDIFQKKVPSFMNQIAREKGCLGNGSFIRTLNSSFSAPGKYFAAANTVIECNPSPNKDGYPTLPQISPYGLP